MNHPLTVLEASITLYASAGLLPATGGRALKDRVDRSKVKPATIADGAPTTDELMRAFNVPEHRRARVDAALSELIADRRTSGRDPSAGILGGIHVSGSRVGGRALKDRIRHLAGEDGSPVDLVDSGAARLVVHEAGLDGVIAISGSLYKLKPGGEEAAWRILGPRFLGQLLFDCIIGGGRLDGENADDIREEAHGYVEWLRIMHRDGPGDMVDLEMLTEFDDMMDAASIDRSEAANLLFEVVTLVDRIGPYVPRGVKPGSSVMEHVFGQLELGNILSSLHTKPHVLQALQQRRRERRAHDRLRIARRVASPPPTIPLFDLFSA
jgi:hypothetical protein